jgi:microcin C transport system permease protein
MTPRRSGTVLLVYASLSACQQLLGYRVPVLKIPFLLGSVLGWILLVILAGVAVLLLKKKEWQFSPLTMKQLGRFKSLQRGYGSFLILVTLAGVASLDTLLVGKRALLVHYQGQYWCPFLRADVLPGKTFGQATDAETNYRELAKTFVGTANWVVMPPIPFDTLLDSDEVTEELEQRADGKVYVLGASQPFSGRAYTTFQDSPDLKRQEFTYRSGLKQGEMRGWDKAAVQVERAIFASGQRSSYVDYTADGSAVKLEPMGSTDLRSVVYPPAPPSWKHRHLLGTDSTGQDVLAVLFGGMQQTFLAAGLYVLFVFTAGIVIGGSMGYLGGLADLLGQRMVEIWAVLPFLFVVMIVSSLFQPTLVILVCVLALFGWMGTATLLRTAVMREKARDYVAAARLLGASPARALFKHILPNTIAILVTLAPFEVAGIITSLAALDFLGFGLPPSWGRLLHEGTENFNYPWIVLAAFSAMVSTLILVTFVGEAVREAFDPKKFTVYR